MAVMVPWDKDGEPVPRSRVGGAMAEYVIIVPKQDELIALEWAFHTRLDRPEERTRPGVKLFRRYFPFGSVTFALLDRQTNTYSSVLTAGVIAQETPRLIF